MLGDWKLQQLLQGGCPIDMAWEYITEVLKLGSSYYVTVFEGSEEKLDADDRAAVVTRVPAARVVSTVGADNFWEMGDTGPCGPCSEIHVDSRTPEEKAQVQAVSW